MKLSQVLFFITLCMLMYTDLFSQQTKAYTLIVGVGSIDEDTYSRKYRKSYDGGGLAGVDYDCLFMEAIATENNHNITKLRDSAATASNILKAIESIGRKIQGEKNKAMFTFYFSGHGDTIPDKSKDEATKYDQVLVAFDDFILDDEIDILLRKYFTKSDNLMIVDACHSGTSSKLFLAIDFQRSKVAGDPFANEKKALNQDADFIDCDYSNIERVSEPYNLIYFGAAPDDRPAGGNPGGSTFTRWLGKEISDAKYYGDWRNLTYRKLACRLTRKLVGYQQRMVYREIGTGVDLYCNSQPFKIN